MAYRYLIYRTDFGNTIVRESTTDTSTGGTEQSLYSDFVIPEIQPLYLWRVTGGTDVVPNTDDNINDWLDNIAPPLSPEDDATVGYVTGLTDQKIDKITGATDYVPVFVTNGNLKSSGYKIADLTGSTGNYVTNETFTGYTASTETRLSGIETDLSSVSAQTDTNTSDIATVSATTDQKIDKVTGATGNVGTFTSDGNLEDSGYAIGDLTGSSQTFVGSGATTVTESGSTIVIYTPSGNTGTLTGATNGLTANGQDVELGGTLTKPTTINGAGNTYTLTDLDQYHLTFSGASTITDLGGNGGIKYSGDYSGNYDARSLVDAGFVTGLTSQLTPLSTFNSYTATTDSRLDTVESDIVYLSGQTDLKLNISDFNSYSASTDTRLDNIESDISDLSGATANSLTGATNGLTKVGQDVKLGGGLTENTTISATSTQDLTIDVNSITLQSSSSSNGINLYDTGGYEINIESDGGTISLVGNTSTGTERTKFELSSISAIFTDSRTTKTGIEYAADYASDFIARSLVDKAYVDAVAAGLDVKESVKVATTSGETDIDLTGGTFGGTIDGYSVQDGDRVLVKNQDTHKEQNGVWVYSSGSGTFARAIDFVDPYVTSGAFMFVETGSTLATTGWVLATQDPINIGTTELTFTQFSQAGEYTAGVGISITGNVIAVNGASLAGNSISWTGNTFNVDISSGTLKTALDSKLNVSDFNSYSASTDTRLDNIESDITTLSGETANKLDTDVFTGYTASTETRLTGIEDDITGLSATTETKLDTAVFTGYTASTAPNEIYLIHTGGTNLNTVAATAIDWDSQEVSGFSYSWTGGSDIYILDDGDYEINYNIPYNAGGSQSMAVGSNLILNNSTVIDASSSAGFTTDNGAAANLALPTIVVSLSSGDKLTLAAFRTGRNGTATSSPNGSILIKKKNTLQ